MFITDGTLDAPTYTTYEEQSHLLLGERIDFRVIRTIVAMPSTEPYDCKIIVSNVA